VATEDMPQKTSHQEAGQETRLNKKSQGPGTDEAAAAAIAVAQPVLLTDVEAAVDEILRRLPGEIRLALPLGVGKPNPLLNALYRRVAAQPERRLHIYTGPHGAGAAFPGASGRAGVRRLP
jgi:predicted DCC family thiol-disulfide oxidoreductase YuxK